MTRKTISARRVPVLEGPEDNNTGLLWAHKPMLRRSGEHVAVLALRDRPTTSNGYKEVNAYLTRSVAQELIETLQELIDTARPAEAPPCDYLIDRDGDYWAQCAAGNWHCGGKTLESALRYAEATPTNGLSFSDVLDSYGPLTPYRIENKTVPVVVQPECDYVVLPSGEECYRKSNGLFNYTKAPRPDGSEYTGYIPLPALLREHPGLELMRNETVEQTIELEPISA